MAHSCGLYPEITQTWARTLSAAVENSEVTERQRLSVRHQYPSSWSNNIFFIKYNMVCTSQCSPYSNMSHCCSKLSKDFFFKFKVIGFTMAFNSLQSLDVPWTLVSSVIVHQVLQATRTFIILCALLQTCQTHCCMWTVQVLFPPPCSNGSSIFSCLSRLYLLIKLILLKVLTTQL